GRRNDASDGQSAQSVSERSWRCVRGSGKCVSAEEEQSVASGSIRLLQSASLAGCAGTPCHQTILSVANVCLHPSIEGLLREAPEESGSIARWLFVHLHRFFPNPELQPP